jgi:hypothetical protein
VPDDTCDGRKTSVNMHEGAAGAISTLKVSALLACALTAAWSLCARADGSSLPYGRGGMTFPEMDRIVQQYNKTGELFRIEGECRSSCTELLAIKNVCIDPNATLEFHAAIRTPEQRIDPAKNKRMASYYNSGLRSFVLTNHYMDTWTFHPISGQEVIRKFGYRRCPER